MFTPRRSKEAPMDYEFTSRPNTEPAWKRPEDDEPPRKRPHDLLDTPPPPFPSTPHTPTFGTNQSFHFLFQTPPPPPPPPASTPLTSHPQDWTPPPGFSPRKAFPHPSFDEELLDIDMAEASPPNKSSESASNRNIALGGLKRAIRSRHKSRENQPSRLQPRMIGSKEHEERSGDEESGDEEEEVMMPSHLQPQRTSNHYTLNMPAPPAPPSDFPNVLLGYLQFFWNLSLVVLFLYLVVQFILTVQRDVEQRISEYSLEIVQEIAMCTTLYKNNLCDQPIPAMAQQCASWEACMNRDPTIVGRAKVGAELIAEVLNGFIEPISWKTWAFTLSSLAFLTLFINALLSLYRSRHHHSSSSTPGLGARHHYQRGRRDLLSHPDGYSAAGGYPSPEVRGGGVLWAPSPSLPLPLPRSWWRSYQDEGSEGDGDHKIRYRTKGSVESSTGQNGNTE